MIRIQRGIRVTYSPREMGFRLALFIGAKEQCPRCLGKGHVDAADIERLGKQFKWLPGSCAYCNGRGMVKPRMLSSVPVDTTYLTTDLSAEERRLLNLGDNDALQRAESYDNTADALLKQIRYLHLTARLDAHSIVEFFGIGDPILLGDASARKDFTEYVERVISS